MKTVVISLEKIVSISEELERAFFNWLRENNIFYTMSDFISDNIIVQECDLPQIKKIWPEIINL
jgi:hypothetical protein